MALYNQLANDRLYRCCSELSEAEIKKEMGAFFGSILGTLNHILVGDLIWINRLEGTPIKIPLNEILHPTIQELWEARKVVDDRIVNFSHVLTEEKLSSILKFTNSAGEDKSLPYLICVGQLFNHQTHHRGQIHTLFTQLGKPGPVLDIQAVLPLN